MTTYKICCCNGLSHWVAHTYMAQEALEQAAKRKGIAIKVETHGQSGDRKPVNARRDKNADAVIIAADKKMSKRNVLRENA